MSLLSRLANVFRGEPVIREIDEELASHLQEAAAHGRDPVESRRALGSSLRLREASHDIKLIPWLDGLRADTVFAWRQLNKRRVTSLAAILSLGLAIGASTAAFRLIDALFLRPLPIAHPERLYELSTGGLTYTQFRPMRAGVKEDAELIAFSRAPSLDAAYGANAEIEKANVQFVSGWMFGSFGLKPALGRLLTESDDLQPGAHPVAVLSFDYWTRRFARDPSIIGRTVRLGPDWRIGESNKDFTIVGVSSESFTGTDTGSVADLFLPAMMHAMVEVPYAGVFQAFAMLRPGATIGAVRDHLAALLRQADPSKSNPDLLAEPAASGASAMQRDYRQALAALGVLVALVLLIACANVANLMTAQAAARFTRNGPPSLPWGREAAGAWCNWCWSKARSSPSAPQPREPSSPHGLRRLWLAVSTLQEIPRGSSSPRIGESPHFPSL